MKKILSMGIASAVLALTAIAASADIVAASTDNAVNGGTVTVEVTTTEALEKFGFTVAATGLEVVEVAPAAVGIVSTNTAEDGSIIVAGVGAFAEGSVLATITYTVTGETGSNVAVTLGNYKDNEATFQNLEATVVEGTEPGGDPVDPGTEPGGDPVDPGTEPGGENPGGEDPTTPPDTGVALAIVPAVLAGAAVVVAKKRK